MNERVKRVIVTGASGGIGSRICEEFSSDGFEVVGIDIKPSSWTRGESINLSHPSLADEIEALWGNIGDGLTCVVHAAAEQVIGKMHVQSVTSWVNTMTANVLAVDSLVARHADSLANNSGSVVVIGSVHSVASRKEIGLYSISKSAVEGWVKAASIDYAPIRVNMVAPGAINSGKFKEFLDASGVEAEAIHDRIASRTPLGRIGQPEDVSAAVRFLSSDDASFITGQTLIVDGGATRLLATEVE